MIEFQLPTIPGVQEEGGVSRGVRKYKLDMRAKQIREHQTAEDNYPYKTLYEWVAQPDDNKPMALEIGLYLNKMELRSYGFNRYIDYRDIVHLLTDWDSNQMAIVYVSGPGVMSLRYMGDCECCPEVRVLVLKPQGSSSIEDQLCTMYSTIADNCLLEAQDWDLSLLNPLDNTLNVPLSAVGVEEGQKH